MQNKPTIVSMEMEKKMESTGGSETPTKLNKCACACVAVASIINMIFGYYVGVMSGALIFIKEDLKISEVKVAVLGGIQNLCSLLGAMAAGKTSDCIGRRYTIMLASIIFMSGSILMGYGPNYAVLITGKCIAGVAVGFAASTIPVYSAEISSPTSRGSLTSLPGLCLNIGLLLGFVSNYFFGKLALELGWRLMLGIAAVPSLALAIGILKMPESPRWLVMKGRFEEAKKVLSLVSNTKEEAESRFRDIKMAAAGINAVNKDGIGSSKGVWKELIVKPTPAVRRILLAAIGLHFFMMSTGIQVVVLYGPRIFKKAGVTSKDNLMLANVGMGITKICFALLATVLLDKVGRRKLLLTSVGGMFLGLTGLGFCLTMVEQSTEKLYWPLCFSFVAVYVYLASFSLGLGPCSWVYTAEIFPLKLRAQGASIAGAVNNITSATISMSFISIYEAITIGGTFFMFAGISVVAWLFVFCFLPETKGTTLEDIEMLFTRKVAPDSTNGV